MPGVFRTLVRLSGALALLLCSWSNAQVSKPIVPIPNKSLPVYKVESPWGESLPCRDGAETADECWRRIPLLANQTLGAAGTRGLTLSLTNWQPVPVKSPFFSTWDHSPYLNGGLAPLDRFALKMSGGDLQAVEEIWTPVVPLDTPITRLDWERGPLVMNVFDLRLRRMLSDKVYLAMDYYSTTADSQTYDYQFNVHQPYLGGLGFLGQIYGPIDRDSASLVLEGQSHQIAAIAIRPRIGVWLDSNRVVEFFFQQLKNTTTLTSPLGPTTVGGIVRPGAADSMQSLVASKMVNISEGAVYSESNRKWNLQGEFSHDAFTNSEFRSGDSLSGLPGKDELKADIYRARGAAHFLQVPLNPFFTTEIRSETWDGNPVLTRVRNQNTGWTDAQEANLAVHPEMGKMQGKVEGGFGRSSRMDDQVYWLNQYGASANVTLPLGFGIEGGYSSRMLDPTWEVLYRSNPERFRYPSPGLKPRTDRGFRGDLSWTHGVFFLNGGLDFFRSEDAWLPIVLPSNKDSSESSNVNLPDSLALALRNYSEQQLDAWHLGLGFGLGNWTLELRNRCLLSRKVTDGALANSSIDLSVPRRVFKGRLAWKRSLVEDRLKLDLSWDWEWFSTRYAWASDLHGNSRVEKLDEYLALDFQAAMHIKTFTLYFRSMNMNHDRYATEPGVHPIGVNFRFGVDWVLSN